MQLDPKAFESAMKSVEGLPVNGLSYERRVITAYLSALEPVAEAKAEPVGYVTKEALKLMRSAKPGWHYHMFAKDQSDPKADIPLYASPVAQQRDEVIEASQALERGSDI